MHILQRAARWPFLQVVLCWMAVACVCPHPLVAQQAPPSGPAGSISANQNANPAPAEFHAVAYLDGQWKFHTGDDPLWADPSFDDSSWPAVNLNQSLVEQGFDSYSGYAWYRLKLQPGQVAQISSLAAGQPLALLVKGDSIGQIDVI